MVVDHRQFVAWTINPWDGDRHGKEVPELLKRHGLKPSHSLLDFGCGSLRVGRWLIEYLDADRYFGIDPETWLIEMAKLEEIPAEVWEAKRPTFDGNGDWKLDVFSVKFDYILISDVLLHSAHCQIDKVISGIGEALAPGGMCLIDIILPDETTICKYHYEGDEWQYPHVASHPPECLIEPAAKYGLKCGEVEMIHRGPCPLHWFKFTREETP